MEINESNAPAATAAPPVDPSLPLGPRRKAQPRAKHVVKRETKPKAIPKPEPVALAQGDGGNEGTLAPVVVIDAQAPRVPVVKVKPTKEPKARGKGKAMVGKDGEGDTRRIGRPPKDVPPELLKKSVRAASLGMPLERIAIMCGFHGAESQWSRFLLNNPEFRADLYKARGEGEADLLLALDDGLPGWQAKAWLLERARGYTMRAGIEHSGPNGRPLSVVAQVFTTLEAPGK